MLYSSNTERMIQLEYGIELDTRLILTELWSVIPACDINYNEFHIFDRIIFNCQIVLIFIISIAHLLVRNVNYLYTLFFLYKRKRKLQFNCTTGYDPDRTWFRNNAEFGHESIRFDGSVVMVWAGKSTNGRAYLYIVRNGALADQQYSNEIVLHIVVPYATVIGDEFVHMDNNARLHRARLLDNFIYDEGILRMDCSTYFPGMNLIEHVWDILGRSVAGLLSPPQTEVKTQFSSWKVLSTGVGENTPMPL